MNFSAVRGKGTFESEVLSKQISPEHDFNLNIALNWAYTLWQLGSSLKTISSLRPDPSFELVHLQGLQAFLYSKNRFDHLLVHCQKQAVPPNISFLREVVKKKQIFYGQANKKKNGPFVLPFG